MNYEFHVGDYVETKEGVIGYISSVLATGDAWWMCASDCHGYQAGQEYGIMYNGDFTHNYNRIGQYVFTKPEVKQIEKLTYAESYINGYQVLTGRKLIDTINELVDAVNELMNKNISEGEAKFHACKNNKKEETPEYKHEIAKCNNCSLRYHCDEQTEFICKNNDYCYMSE